MHLQEMKVTVDGTDVFFFRHSFKTARQHADRFIANCRGKYDIIEVFSLNTSDYGDKWLLIETTKRSV